MNTSCHRFGLAGLLLVLSLAAPARAADTFNSVCLSEVLADNRRGLPDENGGRSGWIELHNGGPAPVNLNGWFLTDNPAHLAKWRFPGVGLLPDKQLVVFASGKNRTNDLARLHTSFQLAKNGGYLALVNPATNVVSELFFTRLPADVSFGSVRGESGVRGPFAQPTPGRPNLSGGAGFAPEVSFSRPGGNFTASFTLELKSRTTGFRGRSADVIRYTLDGSLPSTNSPAYTAPLVITNTTHLRARAYQAGLLPGPPRSEAYLRLSTNVLGFTSTLPVLIMDTFGKDVPVAAHANFVRLSVFEPVKGKTSLTNAPVLTTRGGFRARGSSSLGMAQQSFAVQFMDEFNQDKPQPFAGLPADSEWVLYAPNGFDPGMIHNPFIHQLSRELGRYSPRTRFVEVYVVRSNDDVGSAHYHGVHVLEEKIKIGPQRVAIDHLNAEDSQPPQVTGGYLLKFDRPGPAEQGFGAGGAGMIYVEPKEQTILLPQRTPQRQYLHNYFNDFGRALHGPKWLDPAAGYRAYFDVDAAIDYHAVEVLSGNVDFQSYSAYLHKPRGGKIVWGPHWDFDRALGSNDGRDANPRHWNTGGFFGGPWWPRLFSDPDFWQQWVDRWHDLRLTHFSVTNLNRLADQLRDEVREAQPREQQRWGLQPRGGSYQAEIEVMKNWLSNRVDFIDQQFVPPPRLLREDGRNAGFRLTARTNAAIYYTLDGSDPRLAQGMISSNAVRYSNSIPFLAKGRVTARAYDVNQRQPGGPPISTPWSAPVAAEFGTGSPRAPRPARTP